MARKIFVKVQWEFSTAGHLVFWKPYLSRLKILKNYAYTSSENLSTTIRNLYLESLGISKQSLNTLLRFPGFLWIFIGSSLSVWELECFLSVENIEISLYAQTQQSLLLLTQGNIYHCLKFLNKIISSVLRGIKQAVVVGAGHRWNWLMHKFKYIHKKNALKSVITFVKSHLLRD